ncbi:unnamed protein product [Protopolystoma xenopodis]|uniref:Uncharacterized protein n=1 Tax=Protopolystoma xenopodis TaxID=117903 RepID=A0A3S5CE48_9PLAT|nr:unnamed protein product [Protopolystoma xenopodis]
MVTPINSEVRHGPWLPARKRRVRRTKTSAQPLLSSSNFQDPNRNQPPPNQIEPGQTSNVPFLPCPSLSAAAFSSTSNPRSARARIPPGSMRRGLLPMPLPDPEIVAAQTMYLRRHQISLEDTLSPVLGTGISGATGGINEPSSSNLDAAATTEESFSEVTVVIDFY